MNNRDLTANSDPKYVMVSESMLGVGASDSRLDSGKPFFKSLDKISKIHNDEIVDQQRRHGRNKNLKKQM